VNFRFVLGRNIVRRNANDRERFPQIISVTGHELGSATQILKHYLACDPELADEAIRQMIAWYGATAKRRHAIY